MNGADTRVGILIVSHGSPREETNRGFEGMVARVASRLGEAMVLPAFFSIARPNIADQVTLLAGQGVRRIVLMPYFLYSGQHITVDFPAILDDCRRQFPEVALELLPTLENDPSLEDVVVERLTPHAAAGALPNQGAAIEARSFAIIDRQLGDWAITEPGVKAILRRVIHSTADISFARSMRLHSQAVEQGLAALRSGAPVFCDVKMLVAGLTKVRGEVVCLIDRDEVVEKAKAEGCTRAAAEMELMAPRMEGGIVAVGNAPTALWRLLELVRSGSPRPALVVGLPVGFVGAREAKQALLESDLCYITNIGPRGGSPMAAAVVNALAVLAEEE